MKNILIWTMSITLLLLSGCIPSLHGIVTDNDAMIDDRILGSWIINDAPLPSVQMKEQPEKIPQQDTKRPLTGDYEMWQFERAANITYSDSDQGQVASELMGGSRSMLPSSAEIIKQELLPYYLLTHSSIEGPDTITNRLIIQLTMIENQVFMDFLLYEGDEVFDQFGRFYSNFLRAHTFAKLVIQEEQLVIFPFDSDYIENLLRQKRIRLKHETINDGDLVLTASTEELRAFISKYVNDQELYESGETLFSWHL